MLGLQFRVFFLISALFIAACKPIAEPPQEPKRSWAGTDFSQLPKIEAEGFSFRNADSTVVDPIAYLGEVGTEVIRLKVWNNASGDGSLEELVPMCERIHDAGMKVMLTFHYSNTWADPGAQHMPTQWEGLSLAEVLDSVERFTETVVAATQAEYVQIGNEINHGMIKPLGNRDGSGNFQKLIAAGLRGARLADTSIVTFLHYAGTENADLFFATVDSLNYDAIGLSYYPRWHGKDLEALLNDCLNLQDQFLRPVYLVETSYPFTLGWADWTNNHIGSLDQILPEYPPTRAGQFEYVQALREITDSLETGLLYWGGELVPYRGPQAQDGSPYENQALFSFNGVALPAIQAFK